MPPELTAVPSSLYRIARLSNPLGPVPWEYRGHGRFDISGANLSVESSEIAGVGYWVADPVISFLEVLTAFRKWDFPVDLLEIADKDPLPGYLIGGIVPPDWLNTHCLVRVSVGEEVTAELPVVDLEAAATVAYINSVGSLRKLASERGFHSGIHRGLILSDDRVWTQSLSIHAHGLTDPSERPIAGLCHTSKWGYHLEHDARCYTLYNDRVSFEEGTLFTIDKHLTPFAEAVAILNLAV